MEISDYLKHSKKIFFKKGVLPVQVTFFVTNKCNCACKHCFALKELNNPLRDDLTLDEIRQISFSMGNFIYLLIGGGEPFLRPDLPEIVRIFYENNNVLNVTIATNGSLTDTIIDCTKQILRNFMNTLTINVSFDGIGKDHDNIRKQKGIFEKAVLTHNALKRLKTDFQNLNVGIIITHSPFNQDKIKDTYLWLKKNLMPDSIVLNYMRGDIEYGTGGKMNISFYEELSRMIEKDNISGEIVGHRKFSLSDFNIASKIMMRKLVSQTVWQKKWQSTCYAGILNCVIMNDGVIFPCEMLDMAMGNLRENNYNFKKIWFSENAEKIRQFIRETKCFCTEECNININILFNPRYLIKLIGIVTKKRLHGLLYGKDKNATRKIG